MYPLNLRNHNSPLMLDSSREDERVLRNHTKRDQSLSHFALLNLRAPGAHVQLRYVRE